MGTGELHSQRFRAEPAGRWALAGPRLTFRWRVRDQCQRACTVCCRSRRLSASCRRRKRAEWPRGLPASAKEVLQWLQDRRGRCPLSSPQETSSCGQPLSLFLPSLEGAPGAKVGARAHLCLPGDKGSCGKSPGQQLLPLSPQELRGERGKHNLKPVPHLEGWGGAASACCSCFSQMQTVTSASFPPSTPKWLYCFKGFPQWNPNPVERSERTSHLCRPSPKGGISSWEGNWRRGSP